MSFIEYTLSTLTDADFKRLSAFIHTEIGIKLSPVKKSMLEGRLQKRLKALQIATFKEYIELVLGPRGDQERIPMFDLVTTNKTDFFREPVHFTFLQSQLLPDMALRTGGRPLKCWSAGCSSGEEPYTLAMVLSEYAQHQPLPGFHIYATDLSTHMLAIAVKAVYPESRIAGIPIALRHKYLLRSKDHTEQAVRIASPIRSKVQFGQLNFMDDPYDMPMDLDIIFCRNVLIYFDKPTQERVIQKFCGHLQKGGYLFLGHSESITDMDLPLVQVKPTIFRKV